MTVGFHQRLTLVLASAQFSRLRSVLVHSTLARSVLLFFCLAPAWCLGQQAAPNPSSDKASADTADERLPDGWHFRFDLFQMLLEQSGVEARQSRLVAQNDPESSVIVIMGRINPRWLAGVAPELLRFVRRGGALLVASDTDINTPLWNLNRTRVLSADREVQYQGFTDCLRVPIADTATRRGGMNAERQLVKGVSQVILNRTGWISTVNPQIGPWAAEVVLPDSVIPSQSRGRVVVASAVQPDSSGRVVLAADHSLFTNGMLWHGDNAIFAINVAKFLTAGNRRNLVFFNDGGMQPSYTEALPPSVLPPPPDLPMPEDPPVPIPELTVEQMLQVANTVVAKAEDSDLANELLADRPRRIASRYYRRGLLLALMAALLLVGVYQLTGMAQKPSKFWGRRQTWSAAEIAALAESDDKRGAARRRGAAARVLAQDFFRGRTMSDDPQRWSDWQRDALAEQPLSIEQKSRLSSLQNLAMNEPSPLITRQRLLQVQQDVRELAAALPHSP